MPATRLVDQLDGVCLRPTRQTGKGPRRVEHLSSCDSCCPAGRSPGQAKDSAALGRSRGRRAARGCGGGDGGRVRRGAAAGSRSVVLRRWPGGRGRPPDQPTSPARSTDSPLPAGLPKELNVHPRYRVVAPLGVGGMGAVYKAEHRLMDRPVALKVIRGDLLGNEAMVERFRREVKAAARLASHPNIVAAYDAEQAGETHLLVMEFVEGTDLARWSIAAGRCRSARRATTPARRRWGCSTPSSTGWSTATSSRRT